MKRFILLSVILAACQPGENGADIPLVVWMTRRVLR